MTLRLSKHSDERPCVVNVRCCSDGLGLWWHVQLADTAYCDLQYKHHHILFLVYESALPTSSNSFKTGTGRVKHGQLRHASQDASPFQLLAWPNGWFRPMPPSRRHSSSGQRSHTHSYLSHGPCDSIRFVQMDVPSRAAGRAPATWHGWQIARSDDKTLFFG